MTAPRLPDRYRLRDRLGIGGMGVVWEAWDHERQQLVALKTIREPSARRVVDFKREFRYLSEIAHPNLVRLYELEIYEGVWFLTMERLFGAHFLDHVRPGAAPTRPITGTTEAGSGRPVARAPQRRTAPLDHARLRSVLPQLASAITCLHEHGFLHRDIKSSNCLVGADNHTTLC
ncbi:MAG: protein kinase, partial [Kofleriaceae bacterium]